MGLGLFKRCYTNYSSTVVAPDPNPSRYRVIGWSKYQDSCDNIKATALEVEYTGCTNFEGRKILVYLGDFTPSGDLDPHFTDKGVSPVARFKPDREGKTLAVKFCKLLAGEYGI